MTNEHFAARLKSARIMNGFSLQDLADKLNNRISRQALHKYEKGEVIPDSEMMGYLCESLGVRPDYFHQSIIIELGPVEFRKLKNFTAKEKSKIEEQTKDILARYFEIEEILGIETNFENPITDIIINTIQDVEDAAEKLRVEWELGTDALFNIIELLEDKGIKVIEIDEDPAFSGMQTWVGQVPVIVLNKNKEIPLDRKRFTALHELSHLLLSNIDKFPEKIKEHFCHFFAGAMLFPKASIKAEIGGNRNRLLINELGVLKQQYGISILAIVYRLKDIGMVSENYHRQFMFMMDQLNIRKLEPVKYDYQGVEKSNRFDQLIFRALGENLISMNKAASLKNQKLAEFRAENMLA